MADTESKEREETPNAVIERAKKFLQEGCGCSRGSKGGPCSREFREETVLFNLNNCLELTSGELDLIIFANIQAFTSNDGIGTKRSGTSRCTYQFQSVLICKEMFLHLYDGISYSRLRRLKEHYEKHGIHLRTHGNTKRLPSNTLPQSTTAKVHHFLTNYRYVEENAFVPTWENTWIQVQGCKGVVFERNKNTVRRRERICTTWENTWIQVRGCKGVVFERNKNECLACVHCHLRGFRRTSR